MLTPAQSPVSDRHSVAPWVAAVDGLTWAGCLLTVIVAIGGGFRFWLGDVRISVTSPIRLLACTVVVGLIRHALVRRPTLLSRTFAAARRVWSTEEWRAVWPAFVVTRVMVLTVGLLAVHTVGFPTDNPPLRASRNKVANLPVRWDAGWYLDIASRGYRWRSTEEISQQNIAFFPALPVITGHRRPAVRRLAAQLRHRRNRGLSPGLFLEFDLLLSARPRRSGQRRASGMGRSPTGCVPVLAVLRRDIHRIAVPAWVRRCACRIAQRPSRAGRGLGPAGWTEPAQWLSARGDARSTGWAITHRGEALGHDRA